MKSENTTLSEIKTIEFDEFCEMLMTLGALNSPSELHGVLCGKLCGGAKLSQDQWLKSAWDVLDIAGQPNVELEEPVLALYTITQGQLDSGDYDLQPFLPDDYSSLEERLIALSQWCHGFLNGFGTSGLDANAELSADQADSLRDLAAIVQVSLDGEDSADDERDEEEQESDYSDLIEHVRIVALNFYEDNLQEISDRSETPKANKIVH